MNRLIALLSTLTILSITGCGGIALYENVEENCGTAGNNGAAGSTSKAGAGGSTGGTSASQAGNGGSAGKTTEPSNKCSASPYDWQDEVLFVCPSPLAFTTVNASTGGLAASFQLVNYRGLWINSIKHVCVKNIGPTPLNTIPWIHFINVGSYEGPVSAHGPWPDNKVCVNISITVGAEGANELQIHLGVSLNSLPTDAQYQFEIEKPSDIVFGDNVAIEPIVGDFPVKSEVITVTDK